MYKTLIRPILFQLDPETVHEQVCNIGKIMENIPPALQLLSSWYAPPYIPELCQDFFGYSFQNPIGLAAGFNKNIQLINFIRALGFGFEEVGSISYKASKGNSRPRLFRLPEDRAIINRMGLNNHGVLSLLPQIKTLPKQWPVGISLVKTHNPDITGKDAIDDFAESFKAVYGEGAYVCLNISCPNTKEGKTFEDPDILEQLLKRLQDVESECQTKFSIAPIPVLLKISPDLDMTKLDEIFDIATKYNISGWVACNTTTSREGLKSNPETIASYGKGGLSGMPLKKHSTRIIGHLYQLCQNYSSSMMIIGVGGIYNTDSAWEKITHGASLLQVYTGLIYEGPCLIKHIVKGLSLKLKDHNFYHIKEAVGSAFR